MPRHDLLALSLDDLATLTNRGTVKRAERELDAGTPTAEIRESEDGTLLVSWSDGILCRFPAGKTLHDAVCSSGAVGVSRHVVRSVLAYQKQSCATVSDASSSPAPDAAWDPGAITDEMLENQFRRPAVAKARARFDEGVLVELIRGAKPVARFLDEPCTLRFLVPGDLRYVHGDCSKPHLALYVPLAVWAFRELDAAQTAGIVSRRRAPLPAPVSVLDELDARLEGLAIHGFAGCPSHWRDGMLRVEERCRDEGLFWPAEIVADLVQQHERYHAHDALFDPQEVVQHVGELAIRGDAIRSDSGTVPQPLVRGTRLDRLAEIGAARFIGLGCGVRGFRGHVRVTAFLQDAGSGTAVGVDREFADPPAESADSPKDFHSLGSTHVARGVSLATLGTGQLLLKSGKRTPGHRLVLPRGPLALNPQAFEWEKLRPPVLAESFAELRARLELLPPASLRPRRMTENLHVCRISAVGDRGFDAVRQQLFAELRDAAGDAARLELPYTSRGRPGFEALAARLEGSGTMRFVSAHVTLGAGGIALRPVCVVFETEGRREAVQPWIDVARRAPSADSTQSGPSEPEPMREDASNPVEAAREELRRLLADVLVTGLRTTDRDARRAWQRHAAAMSGAGFVRMGALVDELARRLAEKSETLSWDPLPTARLVVTLCLLQRLADDLSATT